MLSYLNSLDVSEYTSLCFAKNFLGHFLIPYYLTNGDKLVISIVQYLEVAIKKA